MAQVKLDLSNKSVPEKIQKGLQTIEAMSTPVPPPPPYTPLVANLQTATDALQEAETKVRLLELDLRAAHDLLDAAEAGFGTAYAALGNQVQVTSGGNETLITNAGYEVRNAPNPVTSLDGVTGFAVTTTNLPGTFDFHWDKERGAMNYEVRGRLESAPAAQYAYGKTVSKTRLRAGGFQSGVPYLFSICSFGARDMESPWSNEFRKIAG